MVWRPAALLLTTVEAGVIRKYNKPLTSARLAPLRAPVLSAADDHPGPNFGGSNRGIKKHEAKASARDQRFQRQIPNMKLRPPRRWAPILALVALAAAAIVAVPAVREAILRAAGWALVLNRTDRALGHHRRIT